MATKARLLGNLVAQGQPLLEGFVTQTYVDNKVAALVNSAPATLDTLKEIADQLAADQSAVAAITTTLGTKANITSLAQVATSGSYADLINKPTLFSGSYADLTNKPTLFDGSYNTLTDKPTLFSGSYADLTNKPTLFTGSYNDLADKPTFAAVATSGSYVDLNNKPTLETSPSITSIGYSGNDLATDTTNPLAVTIIGTGFEPNSKVYIDTITNANSATALQFSGTTQITFIPPAKPAASYNVWVVSPTGKMAVLVNGILYSGTPSWAGVATTYTSTLAVNIQLTATSTDTPLVYSLVSGTLPTGVTLSSTGLLSGTATGLTADTSFPNIVIRADDPQNQDASITIQLNITVIAQISRSLRFNPYDSARLTRTPASASNRTTWTWSGWVKRSNTSSGDRQVLFGAYGAGNDTDWFEFGFGSGGEIVDSLYWTVTSNSGNTTAVFRDYSAWYHIVLAYNGSALTLYVNNTTYTLTGNRTGTLAINGPFVHTIGKSPNSGVSRYFDGYMAEVNFVDGLALTPSSFGQVNPSTGVWSPIRYIGTYGTNGFYLNFADNTSATSVGIAKDNSASAINRMELGNTSVGYTVLGTMTFTGLLSANAVNLRDNSTSTFAADPNALNANTAMGYDFGTPVSVRRIVTITATSYGVDTATTMNIQYSDDGTNWATVTGTATQHSISAGLGITNTTNISDNGAHRYWRLIVASGAPTGGNFWFSTLDMFASGIGPNSWFPINFSVTGGNANDSFVDSPTIYGTDTGVGGEVRGNYCTLNNNARSTAALIQDGGLYLTASNNLYHAALGTFGANTGKWYFEIFLNQLVAAPDIGWHESEYTMGQLDNFNPNSRPGGYCIATDGNGNNTFIYNNGTATQVSSSGWNTTNIIGCAIDMDTKKIWFHRNGTYYPATLGGTVGNPATGTNPTMTYTYSGTLIPRTSTYGSSYSVYVNFGQRPFAHTAPSGFKALSTQNLPNPTIGNTNSTLAGKYFNTVTWTGNGTNPRQITGVGFQPDFVWTYRRDVGYGGWIYDVLRGPSAALKPESTGTGYTYNQVSSFDADGFTQSGTNDQGNNINGGQYIAWNWKAGVASSSNTAGSITSTVSANTTSRFSIATYSGNGVSGGTVGHGLGVTPSMIILKGQSNTFFWRVYHSALTSGYNLFLNATDAQTQFATNAGYISAVSATTFTLTQSGGSALDAVNATGQTYVAYCFAEVAGYSKFGSYTGNGSSDGPFVFCGFRPKYVIIKRMDAAGNWQVFDSARSSSNAAGNVLFVNGADAEANDSNRVIDFVSNGFKLRAGAPVTSEFNGNGASFVFVAFAETPFKYSLAR